MASAEVKLLPGGKKSRLQTRRTDDGRYVTEVRLTTFTVILCTVFCSVLNLQILNSVVLASTPRLPCSWQLFSPFYVYVLACILHSSVNIVAYPCEYFAIPV